MATPRPVPQRYYVNVNIVTPAAEESVSLNADGTVSVRVDADATKDKFRATIYSCPTQAPAGPIFTNLIQDAGTNTWRANVPAGDLDPFDILEHHKFIEVHFEHTGVEQTIGHYFRIHRPGSASLSCSGSGSQRRCDHCSPMDPVPVCVQVQNPQQIQNNNCPTCTVLNQNVTLQHCNDPCLSCCWFSGPLAFCDANPGYWKLEKINASTWELRFCHSQPDQVPLDDIAVYNLTTAANVCTFPITLNRVSNTTACQNWPNTITVSPAP